ncbi:folate-binding protein YgfZ [Hoyosella sp. YIM 151337]|uniref:CAF17-like 4Fe-4S cluster assembly/insertion protein YgfZ n=1 Tax=Hoyosella sp. YIM 151337 TaxID=2992742 RepID=UPI0022360632|nr:folate-binding protein YgfZ [Hoyosella sp. YIM 151337]MCW4354899.1 folate-binding protein YgfZ [Hoyosella sp. YIM 151337]
MLAVPGAVPAPEEWPDQGVAWHCGDPLVEQRAGAEALAVIDRSHRTVISVTGADRLTWLHSLASQSFTDLAEGQTAESLILDVNGRIEHHFIATHFGETLWLDTERDRAPALLGYLRKMIFWSKVEVTETDMAVVSLLGPRVSDAVADISQAQPFASGFTRPLAWPAEGRADAIVPRAELRVVWQRLTDAGAHPAGTWAFEALRVTALRPRVGVDTDERTIPHEARWIGTAAQHGAVHLEKGCYRGQETVARVHNLGRPPRHLVLLHLDGSDEHRPVTGDPVSTGGRAVGRVGTVVDHFEYGPIALGLLKRTVPVDSELTAGAPGREVAASIDPDSLPSYDEVQPGRAAVDKLRGR